jgi:hypothetical protein
MLLSGQRAVARVSSTDGSQNLLQENFAIRFDAG